MGNLSPELTLRIGVFCFELLLTFSLIVWIRSTTYLAKPEPWGFFFKILIYGGIAALISAAIELRYSIDVEYIRQTNPQLFQTYGVWLQMLNGLAASSIEELAKYALAVCTVITPKRMHRFSDAITYLILIGLGFSLVEDLFFLLNPEIYAPYRLLSFYVHSGTSAIIGYSLGRLMSGQTKYQELVIAVLGAIGLHFAYNLSTNLQDTGVSLYLTGLITAYISLQIFILFRRAILEEYRLGHRSRRQETQALLNLHSSARHSA